MGQTKAVSPPSLPQSAINDILKQVDGIGRLGRFAIHSDVPSPVTAKDISDAVRYILDCNIVGKFSKHVGEVSHAAVSGFNSCYEFGLYNSSQKFASFLTIPKAD